MTVFRSGVSLTHGHCGSGNYEAYHKLMGAAAKAYLKKKEEIMTHEKPAMPEEIWVNRDPNSGNSFYGADGRLHQYIKDSRTKYIRADLAHPQAEAVDVEAVKQEIAETFKSMDKVEILIVNLVIDFLAAKGLLKTDKSE